MDVCVIGDFELDKEYMWNRVKGIFKVVGCFGKRLNYWKILLSLDEFFSFGELMFIGGERIEVFLLGLSIDFYM